MHRLVCASIRLSLVNRWLHQLLRLLEPLFFSSLPRALALDHDGRRADPHALGREGRRRGGAPLYWPPAGGRGRELNLRLESGGGCAASSTAGFPDIDRIRASFDGRTFIVKPELGPHRALQMLTA